MSRKAVNTAVTNAQEEMAGTDRMISISEAEKLAKMTKEEKAQYMQQKKEKELSEREATITRKELMVEARNTLAGDGLPQELSRDSELYRCRCLQKVYGDCKSNLPESC